MDAHAPLSCSFDTHISHNDKKSRPWIIYYTNIYISQKIVLKRREENSSVSVK